MPWQSGFEASILTNLDRYGNSLRQYAAALSDANASAVEVRKLQDELLVLKKEIEEAGDRITKINPWARVYTDTELNQMLNSELSEGGLETTFGDRRSSAGNVLNDLWHSQDGRFVLDLSTYKVSPNDGLFGEQSWVGLRYNGERLNNAVAVGYLKGSRNILVNGEYKTVYDYRAALIENATMNIYKGQKHNIYGSYIGDFEFSVDEKGFVIGQQLHLVDYLPVDEKTKRQHFIEATLGGTFADAGDKASVQIKGVWQPVSIPVEQKIISGRIGYGMNNAKTGNSWRIYVEPGLMNGDDLPEGAYALAGVGATQQLSAHWAISENVEAGNLGYGANGGPRVSFRKGPFSFIEVKGGWSSVETGAPAGHGTVGPSAGLTVGIRNKAGRRGVNLGLRKRPGWI
ncbi:MAG: hypothetical protein NT033_07420 [Candidatus Omnitrophica bacterium]|nr:hypothetical protein [Candidatus Omnitrophota bacterium]